MAATDSSTVVNLFPLFGASPFNADANMADLRDSVEDWRDIAFPALEALPECPALKIIKRDANAFISSLWSRRRDFASAALEFSRLQIAVTGYIIEVKHIGRAAHISKTDKPATIADGSLDEIEPRNKQERRAMVILRVLKLHPDRAFDTANCKDLLEASEGTILDRKIVMRALLFLESRYNPWIVLEKRGKNYRIRTNFSPNRTRHSVPENQDSIALGQGVLKDSERWAKEDD